jgi:fucose permease
MALIGWSFWSYEKESVSQFSNSLQQIASRRSTAELGSPSKLRLIGRALKTRVTLIGALFVFAYQGAEVAEAGWVITYLIVS